MQGLTVTDVSDYKITDQESQNLFFLNFLGHEKNVSSN